MMTDQPTNQHCLFLHGLYHTVTGHSIKELPSNKTVVEIHNYLRDNHTEMQGRNPLNESILYILKTLEGHFLPFEKYQFRVQEKSILFQISVMSHQQLSFLPLLLLLLL
jgi:hypothetical protein